MYVSVMAHDGRAIVWRENAMVSSWEESLKNNFPKSIGFKYILNSR